MTHYSVVTEIRFIRPDAEEKMIKMQCVSVSYAGFNKNKRSHSPYNDFKHSNVNVKASCTTTDCTVCPHSSCVNVLVESGDTTYILFNKSLLNKK